MQTSQLLQPYCTLEESSFSFTREQASHFAKLVANDFNPIHDVDAKRFCVPGDLLFSVALTQLGLSQEINVRFADMVTEGVSISFQQDQDDCEAINLQNSEGKTYLSIHQKGERNTDSQVIEQLTKEYVAFSGKTFPHILVPLWKEKNVMVNPARPMVIYQSMSVHLDSVDLKKPTLEYSGSSLEVNGKRGNVSLRFNFLDEGEVVGHGEKTMVLSGLKPYEQNTIDDLIAFYDNLKATKMPK